MMALLLNKFKDIRKAEALNLVLFITALYYYASVILKYTFPNNVVLVFLPAIFAIIFFNIHLGILLWYVFSVTGNVLSIDLPGIPPLHIAQLILLIFMSTWILKSYKAAPSILIDFFSDVKNKVLLILFGWITFSMVMGQVTGVTQMNYKYQFGAWLSIVFVLFTALLINNHYNKIFLKKMIMVMIIVQAVLLTAMLLHGRIQGIGLLEWKEFVRRWSTEYNFVLLSPLFAALIFMPHNKLIGKAVYLVVIAISLIDSILLILNGHRSTLFWLASGLVSLAVILKPRFLLLISILVIPVLLWLNMPSVESFFGNQAGYTVTDNGEVYGSGARIVLNKDATRIIKKYPLWGTGSDFYRLYSEVKVMYPDGKIDSIPSAHNAWLQTAVDNGIITAVLLLLFCIYLFRDTIKLVRTLNDPFLKSFAVFFFCNFCSQLAGSLVSSGFILPVFTGTLGDETSHLAGTIFSFWIYYGFILGIENETYGRKNRPNE